jgi:CheY-like chemotaxis protein
VLVVEDSPAVALSLQVTITQWNHVVEICHDGFSALAAARTFKPDVVLTDLGLPRMSGYQLAQELRRLPEMRHVAIIAVSGYGQEADRNRTNEAGFSRHLVKPINPLELGEILAQHAVGKQAHS